MLISPIYSHPKLYEWTMRMLYGAHFNDRYIEIIRHIPAETHSLVELCMGDAYLFRRHLQGVIPSYRGSDINQRFVRIARKRGITAEVLDARTMAPPQGDVVLMQASLYQFIPDHLAVIDRMISAARKVVIIAEPVVNVTSSGNRFISWLGAWMSNAGQGNCSVRFSERTFSDVMHRYDDCLLHLGFIPGDREMVAVLDAERWRLGAR